MGDWWANKTLGRPFREAKDRAGKLAGVYADAVERCVEHYIDNGATHEELEIFASTDFRTSILLNGVEVVVITLRPERGKVNIAVYPLYKEASDE